MDQILRLVLYVIDPTTLRLAINTLAHHVETRVSHRGLEAAWGIGGLDGDGLIGDAERLAELLINNVN